jgi:hypothetical protein
MYPVTTFAAPESGDGEPGIGNELIGGAAPTAFSLDQAKKELADLQARALNLPSGGSAKLKNAIGDISATIGGFEAGVAAQVAKEQNAVDTAAKKLEAAQQDYDAFVASIGLEEKKKAAEGPQKILDEKLQAQKEAQVKFDAVQKSISTKEQTLIDLAALQDAAKKAEEEWDTAKTKLAEEKANPTKGPEMLADMEKLATTAESEYKQAEETVQSFLSVRNLDDAGLIALKDEIAAIKEEKLPVVQDNLDKANAEVEAASADAALVAYNNALKECAEKQTALDDAKAVLETAEKDLREATAAAEKTLLDKLQQSLADAALLASEEEQAAKTFTLTITGASTMKVVGGVSGKAQLEQGTALPIDVSLEWAAKCIEGDADASIDEKGMLTVTPKAGATGARVEVTVSGKPADSAYAINPSIAFVVTVEVLEAFVFLEGPEVNPDGSVSATISGDASLFKYLRINGVRVVNREEYYAMDEDGNTYILLSKNFLYKLQVGDMVTAVFNTGSGEQSLLLYTANYNTEYDRLKATLEDLKAQIQEVASKTGVPITEDIEALYKLADAYIALWPEGGDASAVTLRQALVALFPEYASMLSVAAGLDIPLEKKDIITGLASGCESLQYLPAQYQKLLSFSGVVSSLQTAFTAFSESQKQVNVLVLEAQFNTALNDLKLVQYTASKDDKGYNAFIQEFTAKFDRFDDALALLQYTSVRDSAASKARNGIPFATKDQVAEAAEGIVFYIETQANVAVNVKLADAEPVLEQLKKITELAQTLRGIKKPAASKDIFKVSHSIRTTLDAIAARTGWCVGASDSLNTLEGARAILLMRVQYAKNLLQVWYEAHTNVVIDSALKANVDEGLEQLNYLESHLKTAKSESMLRIVGSYVPGAVQEVLDSLVMADQEVEEIMPLVNAALDLEELLTSVDFTSFDTVAQSLAFVTKVTNAYASLDKELQKLDASDLSDSSQYVIDLLLRKANEAFQSETPKIRQAFMAKVGVKTGIGGQFEQSLQDALSSALDVMLGIIENSELTTENMQEESTRILAAMTSIKEILDVAVSTQEITYATLTNILARSGGSIVPVQPATVKSVDNLISAYKQLQNIVEGYAPEGFDKEDILKRIGDRLADLTRYTEGKWTTAELNAVVTEARLELDSLTQRVFKLSLDISDGRASVFAEVARKYAESFFTNIPSLRIVVEGDSDELYVTKENPTISFTKDHDSGANQVVAMANELIKDSGVEQLSFVATVKEDSLKVVEESIPDGFTFEDGELSVVDETVFQRADDGAEDDNAYRDVTVSLEIKTGIAEVDSLYQMYGIENFAADKFIVKVDLDEDTTALSAEIEEVESLIEEASNLEDTEAVQKANSLLSDAKKTREKATTQSEINAAVKQLMEASRALRDALAGRTTNHGGDNDDPKPVTYYKGSNTKSKADTATTATNWAAAIALLEDYPILSNLIGGNDSLLDAKSYKDIPSIIVISQMPVVNNLGDLLKLAEMDPVAAFMWELLLLLMAVLIIIIAASKKVRYRDETEVEE